GRVLDEELPYFYNRALLFVFPSFYEGFGFPPLEAMASFVSLNSLRPVSCRNASRRFFKFLFCFILPTKRIYLSGIRYFLRTSSASDLSTSGVNAVVSTPLWTTSTLSCDILKYLRISVLE
ncbi:MAG: glycosyltransferase, partial [Nitrososphaerota archaeon]|nr:glycosyltransferase [Nitrososphaerota archaeon]